MPPSSASGSVTRGPGAAPVGGGKKSVFPQRAPHLLCYLLEFVFPFCLCYGII